MDNEEQPVIRAISEYLRKNTLFRISVYEDHIIVFKKLLPIAHVGCYNSNLFRFATLELADVDFFDKLVQVLHSLDRSSFSYASIQIN